MTKDVLVKISGMQFDIEDEPIELVTAGTYYLKNGRHYVLYEEQPDSSGPAIRNIVKFQDGMFEMTKKGAEYSYLLFREAQNTSTVYQTPAGPVQIDVSTHDFQMTETEEELAVTIRYSLNINYNFISECEVNFKVQAR
ncbi:MAG: DUF1934 domain-containing protein [Lachnospiraceae bacterium]|nr:DUF1934 domain-containing protein [Lachnospiraceae bacterium]